MPTITDSVAEIHSWLDDNWDPDLTVAEWWERLGTAGWSAPMLPGNAYGHDLSRSDSVAVMNAIGEYGALGPPSGLGLLLAAPTIAAHGSQEQIDTFVLDIVTGRKGWCQLFSEPGAGSDLAGLTTKAERDGDEWIITGQKVWTSLGQMSDMGMLIARTDPEVPKHQGITWMAIDMDQPGVQVRPLREMTGHAMFSEVFLDEARVPHADVIGDVNNGWAATNTTLQTERASLGAGGGGGASAAIPGTIAGQLDRRAGDLVPPKDPVAAPKKTPGATSRSSGGGVFGGLANSLGRSDDPIVRQDLMRLHILDKVAKWNGQRVKAAKAQGRDIPGMANIGKLQMSDMTRLSRDLGLRLLGPAGTLHAYTTEQSEALNDATGNPMLAMVTGMALYAQAPPIYGGTDQIQRNIIGERVLGLPKEPNEDKTKPFAELPKNA